MTKGKGRGWFEEKDPDTGIAIKHSKAALDAASKKKATGLSNAEIKPSDNKPETIKKKINAWNPNEDTVDELSELILELKETGDKDYDLSFLPVAEEFKDFVDDHADYPIWTADYNGDILVGSDADEVENVNDFDDYHEAKFDFDVDQVKQIEEYIGAKMEDDEPFDDARGKIYRFDDSSEWIIFEDINEAENQAVGYVREMLDNEPESFTESWLQNFISMTDTDKRVMANEESTNYAYEALDEDDAMKEAGLDIKFDELQEEIDLLESEIKELEEEKSDLESTVEDKGDENRELGSQIDDIESDISSKMDEIHLSGKQQEALPDEAREKVQEDKYDEIYEALADPVQYFVEDQGIYTIEELMKASFIFIDTDEAAQDAVDSDGIAHFLSSYDENEVELDNEMIMYRTN